MFSPVNGGEAREWKSPCSLITVGQHLSNRLSRRKIAFSLAPAVVFVPWIRVFAEKRDRKLGELFMGLPASA